MKTLYHYIHCPYCVRVRMAASFLKVDYQSVVLSYADEIAPKELTGTKMLPIWKDEQIILNESLDIITLLDRENLLQTELLKKPEIMGRIDSVLEQLSGPLFKLCMPYFVWTPEFDQNSRAYFLRKKEAKRGPFNLLLKDRLLLEKQMHELLVPLEDLGEHFYLGRDFSVFDIILASHLWGLYCVPEFRFSDKINNYLQRVKKHTHFSYHQDYEHDDFWAPSRLES